MASPSPDLIEIATRHQVFYERLKSHEVKSFDNFLSELDADLRKLLSRSDITSFTRSRLEKQLALVREIIAGTYADYESVWRDSITQSALYEAQFEKKALDKVVIRREFVLPTELQIGTAVFSRPLAVEGINGGALLDQFFRQLPDNTTRRIEGAIRLGFAQGQTNQQIINRIRGTARAGYTDGILAISRRDADIITRTALQHASSQARQSTWERNRDIIKGVKIVATLDNRTSAICRSMSGMIFKIDEGPRPPFHIRCRTTTVSVLDDRFAALREGATQAARGEDGKVVSVDAELNYYDWLKQQPADFQDSVIGKTRGKLLRDGGLSMERFSELQLNKNFEPMTLEQMKRIESKAFERAGI
ncbi:minor capsid protein [Nitrosomonas communis]|uniref:phage head morphogenesis protein n=1 Tax=Nitrosomonas communis TaxID=44574 RepID=UPI0026EC5652|nr:minor capsid protein [Nitrosomonas communis]MCO6428901.1 minor capsid protein [Nitrosomonas communis]